MTHNSNFIETTTAVFVGSLQQLSFALGLTIGEIRDLVEGRELCSGIIVAAGRGQVAQRRDKPVNVIRSVRRITEDGRVSYATETGTKRVYFARTKHGVLCGGPKTIADHFEISQAGMRSTANRQGSRVFTVRLPELQDLLAQGQITGLDELGKWVAADLHMITVTR